MPHNRKNLTKEFGMYLGKEGDKLSTTHHLVAGEPSWNDGRSIGLDNKLSYFCTNCTFTLLLIAEMDEIIEVEIKALDQVTEL